MTQALESVPEELRIDADAVEKYLVLRLRSYITEHTQAGTAVMGLSGGVDSSVTAALLVKAIGLRKAYLYYLPSESTSKEDEEDVFRMVKKLRVPKSNFLVVNIDSHVRAFEKSVSQGKKGAIERLTLGNIKARVRMTLLHAFAQQHGALVVGTSDKSEITIGYFTKFGDGGVDVMVIGDLFKTQVRQLAAHLGLHQRIYTKPPSPGLWPGQSAEDELGMDYNVLDEILYHRFDLWEDEESVAKNLGVPIEDVNRILRMVRRSQHKRLPPEVFRVSFRSHGSDWRYPREWSVGR